MAKAARGRKIFRSRSAAMPQVQRREAGARERLGMQRSRVMGVGTSPDGTPHVRRAPKVGSPVRHAPGARAAFSRATARFDGREFALFGDGTELLRTSAQSGRPVAVRPSDVRACGGRPSDTYMNDPRYVGIRDMGAIPEGAYTFRVEQMATFDSSERWEILTGGTFEDPFGRPIHGGDWGAGRVPLRAGRLAPAPVRGCGDTAARSGFYLHGGVMPGSSGCIDVGNDGYDGIVRGLAGYRSAITVEVAYSHAAPAVGPLGRFLGGLTYPEEEAPGVLDRLLSAFGQLGAERTAEQTLCLEECDSLEGFSRAACRVGCAGEPMP
jgi:hypothetical protein